ncbi:hypothetical protein M378DRAFT_18368 [Amanita muscaria Koide BX008]|uniref:No apical meristem-associated C-terminal domain-containing protein n=1 Tax=Amanita muscaria (strain Koide BX008) TaxID=946122 RepID=A0A0C2WFU2_AMAMK|nr:hypothetical protein M378DRAFT_18368 [Amanita muscaria Koide BX008]
MLGSMAKDVRKYRDEMGETGAGIVHEEEIDMTLENSLTSSWAKVKEKCPWYWNLKAIISDRPSIVPTGLGNNSSGYDVSLLEAPSRPSSEFDTDMLASLDDETESGFANEGEDEVDDGDNQAVGEKPGGGKRKAAVVEEEKKPGVEALEGKKTVARSGKSAPAMQPAAKKAKTGISKLEAVTMKEEETTQKVLDLRKTRAQGESERQLARIQAKAQQFKLKTELASKKLEIEAKKMDHDFQLRMAQMSQMGYPGSFHAGPSNFNSASNARASSSGWSDAGSATPSSYVPVPPIKDPTDSSYVPIPEIKESTQFDYYAGLDYSHLELGQSKS